MATTTTAPAALDPIADASAPQAQPTPPARPRPAKRSASGQLYVDYKETETLRRSLAGNGKMQGRKRNNASAGEQRLIAQAIKRAREMALMPYVTPAQ